MRAVFLLLPLLAACTAQPPPPAPVAKAPPPPAPPGLEKLIDRPADAAFALLGAATLDRSDGPARLLQWARGPCVLDLFLYPRNGGQLATFAAARRTDGGAITPAQCLQLLTQARPPQVQPRPTPPPPPPPGPRRRAAGPARG